MSIASWVEANAPKAVQNWLEERGLWEPDYKARSEAIFDPQVPDHTRAQTQRWEPSAELNAVMAISGDRSNAGAAEGWQKNVEADNWRPDPSPYTHSPNDKEVKIVQAGEWHIVPGGGIEYKAQIGKSADGYHTAVSVNSGNYEGGGEWSRSYPTLKAAEGALRGRVASVTGDTWNLSEKRQIASQAAERETPNGKIAELLRQSSGLRASAGHARSTERRDSLLSTARSYVAEARDINRATNGVAEHGSAKLGVAAEGWQKNVTSQDASAFRVYLGRGGELPTDYGTKEAALDAFNKAVVGGERDATVLAIDKNGFGTHHIVSTREVATEMPTGVQAETDRLRPDWSKVVWKTPEADMDASKKQLTPEQFWTREVQAGIIQRASATEAEAATARTAEKATEQGKLRL